MSDQDFHTESMRGWTSDGQRLADIVDAADDRGEERPLVRGVDYDTDSSSMRLSPRAQAILGAPGARVK